MNEQKINHYIAVLADLKGERKELDALILKFEQRIDALKGNSAIVSDSIVFTARDIRPTVIKPISIIDTAEKILRANDKPLHATVILQGLHNMKFTKTTLKSLTGSMPQDSKKRFENLGKNVWALREWPNDKKDPYRHTEAAGLPLNEV